MKSKFFTLIFILTMLFGGTFANASTLLNPLQRNLNPVVEEDFSPVKPVLVPTKPTHPAAEGTDHTDNGIDGTPSGATQEMEAKHQKYFEFLNNTPFPTEGGVSETKATSLEDIRTAYANRCNPSLVPAEYGNSNSLDNSVKDGLAETERCLFHFVAITDPWLVTLKVQADNKMKEAREEQAQLIVEEMLSRTGESLTNPAIKSAHQEKAEGHYNQFMGKIMALRDIVALIRDRFNGAVEIYEGGYLKNADFLGLILISPPFANHVMDSLNKTTKDNPYIKSATNMQAVFQYLLREASLSTIPP